MKVQWTTNNIASHPGDWYHFSIINVLGITMTYGDTIYLNAKDKTNEFDELLTNSAIENWTIKGISSQFYRILEYYIIVDNPADASLLRLLDDPQMRYMGIWLKSKPVSKSRLP